MTAPNYTNTEDTNIKNSQSVNGYSAPARVMHWLVAAGIVLQYLLGERAEEAADAGALQLQLASLAQHKSIGITVLLVVLLRIVWRLVLAPPPLPQGYINDHALLARAAHWAHIALYALLLFLPISGWLMSSASAYSVSWFGWLSLPDLIPPSETAKEWLQNAHHLAAKLLFVLAIVHILAAFKHLLIDKTAVMGRMANSASVGVFIATISFGAWLTWPDANAGANVSANASANASADPSSADPRVADTPRRVEKPQFIDPQQSLPLWQLDYDTSTISFTAEQAGAKFTGRWQRFAADIRFDPKQLARSSARVRIDATSVATKDTERDTTLAGSDWFASNEFATIEFVADKIDLDTQEHFVTEAQLKIRGQSYPVQFSFTLKSVTEQHQLRHQLRGTATLDRLALNLGTLEWADTEWVGQFVEVTVLINADVSSTPNS